MLYHVRALCGGADSTRCGPYINPTWQRARSFSSLRSFAAARLLSSPHFALNSCSPLSNGLLKMLYESFETSSSSSSDDDFKMPVSEMRPTDLLNLAMKKRRALYSQKERNIRCEVLQTSFITSLCKHMGESRKRRRRGGMKRSRSNSSSRASSTNSDITPTGVQPDFNGEPLVQTEQPLPDNDEPNFKKAKTNFMDPFGLKEFFEQIHSRTYKCE